MTEDDVQLNLLSREPPKDVCHNPPHPRDRDGLEHISTILHRWIADLQAKQNDAA